jgi:hypothetical protein
VTCPDPAHRGHVAPGYWTQHKKEIVVTTQFIRRDLTLAYVASLLVALVMTVASVAALVDWGRVYPGIEPKMLPLFVGQDALNIIVGLPVLLGSMWLARRGSLIGLLLWPGALFYVLYDYGYYVLGAPFNWFFLAYIGLMTVSAYAAVVVIANTDGVAVRDRLVRTVPRRLTGGVLVGLAVLFTGLWSALTMSALASGSPADPIVRTVVTMDLTVQLPALFAGGVLLWRRAPLGYVVAAGLLLQAATYLIGLSAITVLQEVLTQVPFDAVAVVPGIVVGVVSLALLASFVRGAAEARSSTAGVERQAA